MSKKLMILDEFTGETIEEVNFSGGYNITVTNLEDGGDLKHIIKLDNGRYDDKYWIKNFTYQPIALKLISKFKELKHIKSSKILFIEDMIWTSAGSKTWIAKISRANKHMQQMTGYEYILETRQWFIERMSREQIVAMIYHELRHIDKDGSFISHDIEDWGNMVATLGVDWATTQAMIKDILDDDFEGWKEFKTSGSQVNMFDKIIPMRAAQ